MEINRLIPLNIILICFEHQINHNIDFKLPNIILLMLSFIYRKHLHLL